MHPATAAILEWFEYRHLPPVLQDYSKQFHDLAHQLAGELEGAELTTGLRKLLEAKDCIVRAAQHAIINAPIVTEPDRPGLTRD
jgi:hypothetical protein